MYMYVCLFYFLFSVSPPSLLSLSHSLSPFRMSVTALLNIISNLPSWRPDIVQVFSVFVMRDIPDSTPLVLESSLKVLGQLLSHWRGLVISGSEDTGGEGGGSSSGREDIPFSAMCSVEACALVTFCSYRSMTRRLSLAILKEVRSCLEVLGANKVRGGRERKERDSGGKEKRSEGEENWGKS